MKSKSMSLLCGTGIVLMSLVGCGLPTESSGAETESAQISSAVYGDVQNVAGDTACPSGYAIATPDQASTYNTTICNLLGEWDIARLTGSGSMKGRGYGCTVSHFDTSSLGHTVCKQIGGNAFLKVNGDRPCAPGQTLLSPQEARSRQSEICGKLGYWDIARLSGGGTMKGQGYNCAVQDVDSQSVGNSLCKSLY